jgi:glycosyltransferase involved in cell wall biosynthesis
LLRDEPLRFIIAGKPAAPGDEAYQQKLLNRRAELGLSDEKFMLAGALSMDEMVALYRRASLVTNLSPPGLFDKAALEAMLTATPVIVANPIFNLDDAFLVRDANDPAGVADRIHAVMVLSAEERARIGAELRQRTASEHGLSRLMARLVSLIALE